jgi:hypothetical protein
MGNVLLPPKQTQAFHSATNLLKVKQVFLTSKCENLLSNAVLKTNELIQFYVFLKIALTIT